MGSNVIKSTEEIVSCSDNGQHPLVYISLKPGSGQCQYCGQKFERTAPATVSPQGETRHAA
ncbi:zinc-finger domain-containing protein [Mariprofundus micogutta]|uniref:zinc-finger domain-containing protein n=1 Tax=Mariprofundus micogutta TaxID=1921010 RepID=UPI000933B702|nr:zinc-finger domain-containing protein [Mariprofundus micogutta]